MKRALLIAGGTVGGLGAVLAITPPQLSNNQSALATGVDLAPVGADNVGGTQPEASATPAIKEATTNNANPAKKKSSTTTSSNSVSSANQKSGAQSTTSASPEATVSASPTATATKVASGKSTNGTFVGDPYTMRYGTVQVQITINGGKITDAQAVRVPTGENQRYTDRAIPIMRQNTLAAQSSNITGVSGASYTAYAWYVSLQSALKKAGWM